MQATRILLFLVLLSIAYTVSAQQDSLAYKPTTHIGVQYGINWNNVRFAPPIDQNYLQQQRFAAALRYVGEKHLGIQIELGYDERGWEENIDSVASNYVRTINYFELGAYSHLSIGNRAVRPFFILGSYLGIPLNQTETIPADWPVTRSYYGTPLPERIQYGLNGGLGVEFVIGKFSLQLDGRFRSALGNMLSEDNLQLTFSNSQGIVANATMLWQIF